MPDDKDTLLDELRGLSKEEEANEKPTEEEVAAGEEEKPSEDTPDDETPTDTPDEEEPVANIIDQYLDGEMDAVLNHIHQKVVDTVRGELEAIGDEELGDEEPPVEGEGE